MRSCGRLVLVDAADSAGEESRQRVSLVAVEGLEDVVLDLFLMALGAFDGLAPGVGDRDACYREAIDYLGRTALRVELGRAHLLYGEWLRRQQRVRDARDQLRRAHKLFSVFGMEAFAERARIELRAAGAQVLKRTAGTPDVLTAQEALIARLASAGASNAQIAAQLFISPGTVAYHLSKVFPKLGISSRSQLARTLPPQPDPLSPLRRETSIRSARDDATP